MTLHILDTLSSARPALAPSVGSPSKVLPRHRHEQSEILDALEDFWAGKHFNGERLRRFFESVQVDSRNLAIPLEQYKELTTFGARNDAFIRVGTELSAKALRVALDDAGLEPTDVDAIFFTSVTGIATPSLDVMVANEVGLRRDVKRTPMFGLGCAGGAAGLARVHDYLRAFPEHVAVLLSVELCSLTLQPDDFSVKNLISTGLFGDGASAVVMFGGEHQGRGGAAGPRIVDTRSTLFPDTQWVMGWDIDEDGFEVVLSAKLPQVIRDELRGEVDDFLDGHGLERHDIDQWVMHPGGPAVLDALADAMGVERDAFAVTWDSLASVGNLSSASVLFILADTIASEVPQPGDRGLLVAMGPGFAAEQLLLQW